MTDCWGRDIHYLRLSVTDRCNLRCRYCMPEEGVTPVPHDQVLTYEEMLEIVRALAGLGIDRVRITGGEPLVRRDLTYLVAGLKAIPGIRWVGVTASYKLAGAEKIPKNTISAAIKSMYTKAPPWIPPIRTNQPEESTASTLTKA